MGSGGTTALLPPDKFFSNLPNFNLKSGADTQSRTGDLTLTKGALYQLSHISTLNLKLNASLRLHTRPINVVVFNVPSGDSKSQGELISGQVSCLDAFSTYLFRI